MKLRILFIDIFLIMQSYVYGISSINPFIFSPTNKKDCGSYEAVFDLFGASDRIRDNASPLTEFGAVASLHSSTRNFGTSTHKCGAVLISDEYLLTAAHCMVASNKPISISLGRPNLEENVSPGVNNNIYLIEDVKIHPEYKSETHKQHDYMDIAIIRTNRKVQYKHNIWPVCLPDKGQVLSNNRIVQIAGWGLVNQSHTSPILQQAFIKIVDNNKCVSKWQTFASQQYDNLRQFSYPEGFGNKILCAGRPGVDACNGDSGGPMYFENTDGYYTVIGLISKGIPCGDFPKVPGFYTNVANNIDWIYGTISGLAGSSEVINAPQPTPSNNPQVIFPTRRPVTRFTNPPTPTTPQPRPTHLSPIVPTRRPDFGFNGPQVILIEDASRIPSELCLRPYGKFADPNPAICNTYYKCFNGVPDKIVCSVSLHFNKKTGSCSPPIDAARQNCGYDKGFRGGASNIGGSHSGFGGDPFGSSIGGSVSGFGGSSFGSRSGGFGSGFGGASNIGGSHSGFGGSSFGSRSGGFGSGFGGASNIGGSHSGFGGDPFGSSIGGSGSGFGGSSFGSSSGGSGSGFGGASFGSSSGSSGSGIGGVFLNNGANSGFGDPLCPRLYGKFADPDPSFCDTYYNCSNGVPRKVVCSVSLHFNKKTGRCSPPIDAGRQNCGN